MLFWCNDLDFGVFRLYSAAVCARLLAVCQVHLHAVKHHALLCRKNTYTAGLWRDLTGGLLDIASDDKLSRVPVDLPILITGGGQDPVGGEHEMLNETNRDQVTADWLNWIEEHIQK